MKRTAFVRRFYKQQFMLSSQLPKPILGLFNHSRCEGEGDSSMNTGFRIAREEITHV